MFLTPQNGSTSKLRYGITTSGSGGEKRVEGNSALSAGVWHQVALTVNSNTGNLYVDGALVGTSNSITLKPFSLGNTANNYLGKSQYSSDPYLNGTFDEFRIYTVALSSAEIAATYTLGPDQLLSTTSPPVTMTATPTNLTLTWPLASAGFTLQSRADLAQGGWTNVPSPVPQIVISQWQVILPISVSPGSMLYRLTK